MNDTKRKSSQTGLEIAVIGMAGSFPGAPDIDVFWDNLEKGVESIFTISDEELTESGVSPELFTHPNYVKAKGYLENVEYFDSAFFNYTPMEANGMDPQIRLFHECVWHALENAGYNPFTYTGLIGLYAGYNPNMYWKLNQLLHHKSGSEFFEVGMLNSNHFTSIISYKLNLKGPVLSLNTACSTSLVAIHTACRALLTGETDIALAGGVTVSIPPRGGYLYQEGMIMSPDGRCRPFDEGANGTASGNGVGVVVLKRLVKAQKDCDYIYAVVKGSGINNDGNRKLGYTAPSVEAQAELIRSVHKIADVSPESITFIETHGTGTPLGDPIEFEGLRRAFGTTSKKGYCRLGFIKANMGHLDAAAGVAGFIKTVLALKHKTIPPAVNFVSPSKKIDFENSPFCVNKTAEKWINDEYPLRAGISSLGIGGTNAHIVLEEAPENKPAEKTDTGSTGKNKSEALLVLSAKSQTALNQLTANLAEFFKQNENIDLSDAFYTLQMSRSSFQYRRSLICKDRMNTIDGLLSFDNSKKIKPVPEETKKVVFMFPGLGTQYVNMGLELYETERAFREAADACFTLMKPLLGYDLKSVMYPDSSQKQEMLKRMSREFEISQVATFVLEYALAQLLMKWGIIPQALIGYSFGELVAAIISGVFSLEDGVKLMCGRGKLIASIPEGAMLSVPAKKEAVLPYLNEEIYLAIDNGDSCIVAGPEKQITDFEKRMREKKWLCILLLGAHAIHTPLMNPILKDFEKLLGEITLNKPKIPFISNVSGKWITENDAVNPRYWVTHLCQTVHFAEGLKEVMSLDNSAFIEVGPGVVLTTLAYPLIRKDALQQVSNLVRSEEQPVGDREYLLKKIGYLWTNGLKIDWTTFNAGEKRNRIPLPLYPFDKTPYNIKINLAALAANPTASSINEIVPSDQPHEKVSNRTDTQTEYVAPRNRAEEILARIWEDILGISPIGIHDNLLDMGVTSLKGITFVNKFKEILGEMIHITAVFDAPTVAELAQYFSKHYPESFAKAVGDESIALAARKKRKEPMTLEKIMRYRRSLRITQEPIGLDTPKNPRAVFVISPPRTGSTLLRVILGGHPKLFGPPELNLLFYNTLKERRDDLTGAASSHLQGTIRALMEIKKCSVEEAQTMMEEYENESMSVKDFYGLLQSWIGNQLLVDKSPSYANDLEVLKRMELYFDEPLYIHLTRHPYGMIHSYVDAKMDLLNSSNALDMMGFTREELAEAVYTESESNILEFLKGIPAKRQLTLKFEDIVSDTESASKAICGFLNIEYYPEMNQPYKEKKKRMTDGVYAEGQMIGDPKFHQHKNIDSGVAETWKQKYTEDFLGPWTLEVSKQLGYTPIHETVETLKIDKIHDHLMMLGKSQENGTNIFFIHERTGALSPYIDFCVELGKYNQADHGYNCWGVLPDDLTHYAPENRIIEDVAKRYIYKMRFAQPHGPYHLITWSFGGHIAFEIALQLEKMGEQIGSLIFVDCTGPLSKPGEIVKPLSLETEIEFLKPMMGTQVIWPKIEKMWNIHHVWPFIIDLLNFSNIDIREVKNMLMQITGVILKNPDDMSVEDFIRHFNLDRTFKQAGAKYFPGGKIDTPIYYLKATQSELNKTDHWRDYCNTPITYFDIEGDHHSIFRQPDVVRLARLFHDVFQKTRK